MIVKLKDAGIRVLRQKRDVLRLIEYSNDRYVETNDIVGANIGGHMRHSLNHMQSAMMQITCNYWNPNEHHTIEYDQRKRGTDLETKTETALKTISETEDMLLDLVDLHMNNAETNFDLDQETISCTFKLDPIEAEDQTFTSTAGREIAFSVHHAIHHLAMIRLILKSQGVSISELENLGVAPATEEYNRTQ